MENKKHLLSSLLCFLAYTAYANDPVVPQPWNWSVSSDFGPRVLSVWDWHEGIDFNRLPGNGDFGTPIPAVEGGTIAGIANRGPFYNIDISGNHGVWLYGHVFRTTQRRKDQWELRLNATLVNPSPPHQEITSNVIIQWSNTTTNVTATKILSTEDGFFVRRLNGGPTDYITTLSGTPLFTSDSVSVGEHIAIMGDAGTNNVHLHLGLNYPDDNPFFHLVHPGGNQFNATIQNPTSDQEIQGVELATPFPFKVRINSTGNLDLDKIQMWIEIEQNPNNRLFLASDRSNTFQYGGIPFEEESNTVLSSNGSTTGIVPIAIGGDTLGRDEFIYLQNLTNVPGGTHRFVVSCLDINDNEGCANTSVVFKINKCNSGPDTTPPQITLDPSAQQCVSQPGPFNLIGKVRDNCSDPTLTFQGNAVTNLVATGAEHEFTFNILTNLNAGTNPIALEAVDQSTPTANHAPLNFDIRVGPPGPQLTGTSPPDGATNIPQNSVIQASFNEALQGGQIHVFGAPLSGTSQINGNSIQYVHSGLQQDKTYTAIVTGLGNSCGNSLNDPQWTFSTSNIQNQMNPPPGVDPGSGAGSWSNADTVCVGGSIEVPVTGGPTIHS